MATDRDTDNILARIEKASNNLTQVTLTGAEARTLDYHLYDLNEARGAKDAMAAALHEATDRANRAERQYLDIESGGVHFDLQAARESWAEAKEKAAAAEQRMGDIIAELRSQLDRQLKYRAHDLAAITRVRSVARAMEAEADHEHGGYADALRAAADRVRAALDGEVPDGD